MKTTKLLVTAALQRASRGQTFEATLQTRPTTDTFPIHEHAQPGISDPQPLLNVMQRPVRENGSKFVALGGIWLDEICAPGKETLYDVPGGSVPFGKSATVW